MARLHKAGQQNDWQITALTTATSIVVALNQADYDGLLWDLAASNLDTTLATVMLIRETFAHPIITIATTPSEREQRKLYRAKADAVIDRTLARASLAPCLTSGLGSTKTPRDGGHPTPAAPPTTTYQLGTITSIPLITPLKNGQALNLTKKEFQLLVYLLEHQTKSLAASNCSTAFGATTCWGPRGSWTFTSPHLRDKLEDDPKQPQWLKTVRGFGYRLEINELQDRDGGGTTFPPG